MLFSCTQKHVFAEYSINSTQNLLTNLKKNLDMFTAMDKKNSADAFQEF